MKKIWAGAILGLLFLGGCAQNKEKREEFKAALFRDYFWLVEFYLQCHHHWLKE